MAYKKSKLPKGNTCAMIGESRPLSIILNGNLYDGMTLKNQKFDRKKYFDHVDLYQVRYSEQSDYAKALRATFITLTDEIVIEE